MKRTQAHRAGIFPGLFPERFLGVLTLLSAVAAKTVRRSPLRLTSSPWPGHSCPGQ